jgi:nucleoside-diphosphate kinase
VQGSFDHEAESPPQAAGSRTIRGDSSSARSYNLVHGSDAPDSAAAEIALYFRPDELLSYALASAEWVFPAKDA